MSLLRATTTITRARCCSSVTMQTHTHYACRQWRRFDIMSTIIHFSSSFSSYSQHHGHCFTSFTTATNTTASSCENTSCAKWFCYHHVYNPTLPCSTVLRVPAHSFLQNYPIHCGGVVSLANPFLQFLLPYARYGFESCQLPIFFPLLIEMRHLIGFYGRVFAGGREV